MLSKCKGKKSVRENIFDTIIEHCKTAGIGSSRSLTQIKEKWRALFERYKAIFDNSKKTGRSRESFEFLKIMDEFLGCSHHSLESNSMTQEVAIHFRATFA